MSASRAASTVINRTRGAHWHAANAVFASLPAVGLWYYLSGKRASSAERARNKAAKSTAAPVAVPPAPPAAKDAGTQTPPTVVKATQTPKSSAAAKAPAKQPGGK